MITADINLKPAQREESMRPGAISQCEHIIHIYEEDDVLLEALENFIVGGLRTGESVIAIATAEHLADMNQRLNAYNVDGSHLRQHYICLEVEEALSRFLIGGYPNEELFTQFVNELLDQARFGGRRVRVFGEMVAILWAMGNKNATVRLEQLWNKFCHTGAFSLLCAYPKKGFFRHSASVNQICAAHTKVIER